jgi:hypothetical protein
LADSQDVIVEELDASGLGEDGLAHGEREFLIEGVGVGLDSRVLVLLCCLKEGVIAAVEFGFKLGP